MNNPRFGGSLPKSLLTGLKPDDFNIGVNDGSLAPLSELAARQGNAVVTISH